VSRAETTGATLAATFEAARAAALVIGFWRGDWTTTAPLRIID
jgi:hypothetical protein